MSFARPFPLFGVGLLFLQVFFLATFGVRLLFLEIPPQVASQTGRKVAVLLTCTSIINNGPNDELDVGP